MKKAYKITWISLASVVGVVLIVLLIACYLVFSPKRLTSLVNKHASKFITCEYSIGKVDLTLFKTFPNVGLEINDLVLINPTKGWTTDTLAAIDDCVVSLNIKKMLFGNEIILNSCQLNGGFVNAFFDTEGNNNFDIFPPSEPEEETVEEDSKSYIIDLNKLKLNDIRLQYTDLASNTAANINGLGVDVKGSVKEDVIDGNLKLNIKSIVAKIDNDSTMMRAAVNDLSVDGVVTLNGEDITADASIGTGILGVAMGGDSNIEANLNNLSFKYNGIVNKYDFVKGLLSLNINGLTAVLDGEKYTDNANIAFQSPLEFTLSSMTGNFEKSELRFNDIAIGFIGQLAMGNPDITMNMDVNTNTIVIGEVIRLIPEKMRKEMLAGIAADGKLILNAHVEGVYNENNMPYVTAQVGLTDGYVSMPDALPHPLTNVSTTVKANLDLNGKSDVTLDWLRARMNHTTVAVSGTVNDVLDKMFCDLSLNADLDINDVKSFLPEDIIAQGLVKANVKLRGSLEQFTNLELMKTKLNGSLAFKNLDLQYADTINVQSTDMKVDFILPNPSENKLKDGLASVCVSGADLNADITGMLTAALDDFSIAAEVSNVLDSTIMKSAIAEYGFGSIDFNMDSIAFHTDNIAGNAQMLPSKNEGNVAYGATYRSDSIVFDMGNEIHFSTDALALGVNADYDEEEEDLLLQWNPNLNIDLNNALIDMAELGEPVIIPGIKLNYDENGLNISDSRIQLGNSDFNLEGVLTNLYDHIKNKELLIGDFNFTSDYTDVNQLMDLFSGMGADSTAVAENAVVDTTAKEDNPFMVPYGVDVRLHTLIKDADAGNMKIHNVGGDLTIKDGILVLEQMGFTSDAAEMQLTAIYKSKRKNHLYAGFDFHLLDIDIAEMIRIIPDLDTIVPMLKSFAGKAEFHFAAETNLKSDYSIKYSTLKAACSVEGQDLVVLDSETFNKIKKLLLFSKKTDNKIDSLDVQFTVFKNEIDVYPFAISMDKYSAMLYGRHNLDMSYDYNIAVLSPRLLSRIALEIKGPDFDNMKFKVRRSRHRNMFKPEKRDYKEEKVSEIKNIISSSLKRNVK